MTTEATCNRCYTICYWIDCPTGGWWAHIVHPDDGHDADPGYSPPEQMDDNGECHVVPHGVVGPESFAPLTDPENP